MLANPAQGTVTVNADGTLTFKPAAGITGPVEITYTLKDPGGLSDTAKVTIDVLAPPPGKQCLEFDFSGSKPTDGPDGNILTYTPVERVGERQRLRPAKTPPAPGPRPMSAPMAAAWA